MKRLPQLINIYLRQKNGADESIRV